MNQHRLDQINGWLWLSLNLSCYFNGFNSQFWSSSSLEGTAFSSEILSCRFGERTGKNYLYRMLILEIVSVVKCNGDNTGNTSPHITHLPGSWKSSTGVKLVKSPIHEVYFYKHSQNINFSEPGVTSLDSILFSHQQTVILVTKRDTGCVVYTRIFPEVWGTKGYTPWDLHPLNLGATTQCASVC